MSDCGCCSGSGLEDGGRWTRCRTRRRRLGLNDLETVSAWALVASVGVLAVACWFRLPDLKIIFNVIPIATAPREMLAYLSPLSPDNLGRHENYRLTFEWTCIILVALWWLPFRLAARRGQRVAGGMQAGAAGLLLLTVLLLDFPYRLVVPGRVRGRGVAGRAVLRTGRARRGLSAVLPWPRAAAQPGGEERCQ